MLMENFVLVQEGKKNEIYMHRAQSSQVSKFIFGHEKLFLQHV